VDDRHRHPAKARSLRVTLEQKVLGCNVGHNLTYTGLPESGPSVAHEMMLLFHIGAEDVILYCDDRGRDNLLARQDTRVTG
jgi:hypothetical protein